MKRQFAVIGLGRFGSAVAETLVEKKRQIVAIDRDEEKVQALGDLVTHAVVGDATDEKVLRALGIGEVDVAVVSIGESIEGSVLVVMLLKELGVPYIVAKAVTPLHGKVLKNLGVSRVIFPEREVAVRMVNALVSPNIIEYVEVSANYSIIDVGVPRQYLGKSLTELQLRSRLGVNVIGIRRKVPTVTSGGEPELEDDLTIAPEPGYRLQEGDVLVVIGANDSIEKLRKEIG